MADRDRLFLLRPGFEDAGRRWFCPYAAQVVGYLFYYPEVRTTLDILEIDFARPRRALVDLVGETNQSTPCLVLGDGAPTGPIDGVTIETHEGRRFVAKTIEILRYLAATRGTPPPH
jgi:Protein of unknown function (DUF3088)